MKKFIKVLLVSMLAMALVACGGTGTGDKDSDGKTYEVGVAIYDFDDFMTLYQEEIKTAFKEAAEKDGNTYNVEVLDAKGDQAGQTEQIRNFITQGKDVIIANLVDPTGASVIIAEAKEADIPVVLINREPEPEVMNDWPGKTAYVGVDATQSGMFQGEIIADLADKGDINGDGVVNYITLMGDQQNVDAQQRTEFSIRKLTELGIKSHDVNGTPFPGEWKSELGEEHTTAALTKYGMDIEVIFANNDGMAVGAVRAIEKAGRVIGEDIYIVGVDAIPDAMALLEEGKLTGTVLNDHYNQAHSVVDVAILALNGEEIASYYWHDYVKVTSKEDAELKRSPWKTETVDEVIARYEARQAD